MSKQQSPRSATFLQRMVHTGRLTEEQADDARKLALDTGDVRAVYKHVWGCMTDRERRQMERYVNVTLQRCNSNSDASKWVTLLDDMDAMDDFRQVLTCMVMDSWIT
jgi:membrane peptidoglycan carboxypeptidase